MYIFKNFVHNSIRIGGASICQKIIIQKRIIKRITEKITKITIKTSFIFSISGMN